MNRKAWAAMNDALVDLSSSSHQVISNAIVEGLHAAGFVIVPHEITDKMLEDAGSIRDEYGGDLSDQDYRDWWSAVLHGPIAERQEAKE